MRKSKESPNAQSIQKMESEAGFAWRVEVQRRETVLFLRLELAEMGCCRNDELADRPQGAKMQTRCPMRVSTSEGNVEAHL